MGKYLTALASLLLCTALFNSNAYADEELQVIVATDLHYISSSLTDNGEYYQRVLAAGDSKFMPYIEEITDAFFDEVVTEKPDALLLTGDLTFNGAMVSHEDLAGKLYAVEDAGIPVFVLTGNHDVYNTKAAKFEGDSFTRVPSASTASFREVYADFGWNEAIARDSDSLSYVVQLKGNTRVLMLDLNTVHDFCGISWRTLSWVEEQLKSAQEAHMSVLAAGHQNIFQHSIFKKGYVISHADQLISLFRKYSVPLYLSGHMHIQHISEQEGLTEIATSALCSYPCQYGVVSVRENQFAYTSKRLDMSAWAEKEGRTDPVFQNFQDAAAAYMTTHISSNASPDDAEAEIWKEMSAYFQKLNLAYFSGDLTEIADMDPDGRLAELWMDRNESTALYIQSIQKDIGRGYNVWPLA